MRIFKSLALIFGLIGGQHVWAECADVFNYQLKKLNSEQTLDLCDITKDKKAILVVNTASHCGFTPQFKKLQSVYEKYANLGFTIIGVPSDDFKQESDSQAKTAEVCYIDYGVKFPMTEPQAVRGADAIEMYQTLNKRANKSPKWNFHKHLVDQQGQVVGTWSAFTKPDDEEVLVAIEKLLD
ncbi:glutathione peroxidase [Paraferrimonas sp. SM1919]|uniref:glutathione peroxidase n=1 Tax=Paraferrimonas sp. SM1919 TaxID=2662263 RepID=UPI0013D88F4B|nr:redoxin domain-containing protein [Paraferrimonas sp. SM1919]